MRPRQLLPLATLALLAACAPAPETPPPALEETRFVGRQTCATCHADEDRLWQGSHHDQAMQEATEATVLGDFDGATITQLGVTSTFFRRDGRFFVRTDGPDGKLAEYPVAYTFGVAPLQQYLVEMPGGRLQALPLCWDEKGRRWFHLYPDEAIPAGDSLHWTGANQNWNFMCADCHSTGLRKGYRAGENVYKTTWSEIDVSCEACHGPGSRHVGWARSDRKTEDKGFDVRLTDPGRGSWIVDPETGNGKRLAPAVKTAEIDTCGRCHSRRSVIRESDAEGQPLLDSYRPALLEEGLYHADGQIDGEVYEYGSFLQSRMHAKGVTCSDCHEPHSLTLRRTGNALCTHCHSAPKFDTPDHHKHAVSAQCVDCHMPAKSYMVVDPRRDHSLRVPRPDLSVKIGTPNACNNCHTDRSAQWAAAAVERWYGPDRPAHWGEAIHAARTGRPDAGAALAKVALDPAVPGIARATALSLMRSHPDPDSLPAIERGLQDADPLVRLGAVMAAEAQAPDPLRNLLSDPVRGVRIEAGRALSAEPALSEYRASQEINADRPEAQLNLGGLAVQRGDLAGAERAWRTALRLDPAYIPALVNLADLFRMQGREMEGEEVLRRALAIDPDHAGARHALGLLLVRAGRLDEAVPELKQAADLAPGESRYRHVYEVAIQSLTGQ